MNFNSQGDINGQVSRNLNKDLNKFRLDGSEKLLSSAMRVRGWKVLEKAAAAAASSALPHISPNFVLAIVSPFFSPPPLFETIGCHAEVRGTEKRTRQSGQADKPAYERMMSKVRKKKKEKGDREEGERPSSCCCKENIRTQYV